MKQLEYERLKKRRGVGGDIGKEMTFWGPQMVERGEVVTIFFDGVQVEELIGIMEFNEKVRILGKGSFIFRLLQISREG